MSKDQEYYDGLLIKGYTETQALQYTTQYYPEFTVVQAPQPVEQSNPYLPNIDSIETTMLDSSQLAGQNIMSKLNLQKSTFTSVKTVLIEKKIPAIAVGVILIVILSALVFMIPTTTGEAIEGTWMKADGQKITFDGDKTYSDGLGYSSMWNLDDDTLTVISNIQSTSSNGTTEFTSIVQKMTIAFSEDENAMWLSWQNITVNGEEFEDSSEEGCVLMLKSSVAKSIPEYNDNFGSYESEIPDFCLE
mgnify:FL=1|tara:strand:+ start:286 stop:1026 length:741 start_codon:yes stop_codon:yes gene_type:complete